MGPGDLADILADLPLSSHKCLLLGMEAAADAGIVKIGKDLALVQSLDFFTPIVDDPYEFGQIAAANSLSDIYAVGAKPLTAMNIVCFPLKKQPKETLKEILHGGIDKIHEAGALLIGGHSLEDDEPKYGLSVTGLVHPDRFLSNKGARPGDALVLTKPVGTGILATALKANLLTKEQVELMISIMKQLNKDASETMVALGASAATDITGFGLAGHALEMAQASSCRLVIQASKVPIIPDAVDFLRMGFIPEGDYANRAFCPHAFKISPDVHQDILTLLFDAQTSGGLLISISQERVADFLEIMKKKGHKYVAQVGYIKEEPEAKQGIVEILP